MAEYSKADGVDGQVYNEKYCMKDSWQAKNVDETNIKMGYENMADLANTKRPPVNQVAAHENKQLSPELPGDDKYNYDKNR